MMKVFLIDSEARTVDAMDVKAVQDAYGPIGLNRAQVEHGSVAVDQVTGNRLAIVVHEFSLFVPPTEQTYFSIGANLYAGDAVLYETDRSGETVSLITPPEVMFYRSHVEVEKAIARGEIRRPQTAINGEVVWSWPPARKR
jgi:hypothetical protein